MKKNLLYVGLAIAGLGIFATQIATAANLTAPGYDPIPNTYPFFEDNAPMYMPGDINEITFTWPGKDLAIANTAGIKITRWNDYDGNNFFDTSMLTASGDQATLTYTFSEPDTYDVYIPAGCFRDNTSGDTSAAISISYIISPQTVTEEWLTSSPVVQQDISEFGPQITLTLNREGKFTAVPETTKIKYTSTPFESIPLNQFDESVTNTLVDVSSITRANNNTSLVINLGTTLTEVGWYGLRIMDYELEVDDGNSDIYNAAELWFWYKVSGYSVSPKDGSSVTGAYPGLTIAGNNVVVNNVSGISVYSGYYDASSPDFSKAEKVGQGSSATDTEIDGVAGKLISFTYNNGDLFNGSYTIHIPSNQVTVNGKNVGPLYWHFTITDNTKPLPAVESDPAAGTVSSLKNINLKWGEGTPATATVSTSFYGCELQATGQGGVTLTLPTGQTAEGVVYRSVDVTENPNDLETPVMLGSYLAVQTEGYSTPGKYVLTVAANTYNVVIDKNNIAPNESVTLEFVIEGDEMESEATVLNPVINALVGYPAVEISWGENVTVADEASLVIPVSYQGEEIGNLTAQYINLVPAEASQPGINLLANTNDSGEMMYLLIGSAGLIKGEGEYTASIPANIVYNDEGAYNKAQTISFAIVNELAKATVSPASGNEYEEGDNVTITITFESTPEVNDAVEEPLLVSEMIDGGYEKRFGWSDPELSIDENSVVINLGSSLAPGTYYLSFEVEAVLVDGVSSEAVADYQFVVKGNAPVVNYLEESPVVNPDNKEDSLEPFELISLSWEGYNLQLNDENEISATFNGSPVTGLIESNELMFEVDATEDGSYTLVIPAEYVIAINADSEEYYNESLTLVFVVDSETGAIQGISADANGLFHVVTLNGVKVASGKAEVVKNLGKGLYIINGKKVMIK